MRFIILMAFSFLSCFKAFSFSTGMKKVQLDVEYVKIVMKVACVSYEKSNGQKNASFFYIDETDNKRIKDLKKQGLELVSIYSPNGQVCLPLGVESQFDKLFVVHVGKNSTRSMILKDIEATQSSVEAEHLFIDKSLVQNQIVNSLK